MESSITANWFPRIREDDDLFGHFPRRSNRYWPHRRGSSHLLRQAGTSLLFQLMELIIDICGYSYFK